MSRNTRAAGGLCWIWALLPLAAGCAGLDLPDPPVANVATQRQQRAAKAVRQFETQRDLAQYEAALAHWERGDTEACADSLQRLLRRNPDHRDARLLLAEVYLTDRRTQAAFDQLQQALRAHPDDAQVQYTTALLLDATGQCPNALAYYRRAAELEPDTELYAVACQTAQRAEDHAGAATVGQAGPPDDPPRPLPTPAVVVPDPTAQGSAPASLLAARRPTRPRSLAPPGDTAGRSTALTLASLARTAARADPVDPGDCPDLRASENGTVPFDAADPAETTEFERARRLVADGRVALAEGSVEAALAGFQEAAALCPDNPQIPIASAMAALRHNRPDLAIEILRPAERRFTSSAQFYRILGVAHYRLGDYRSSQVALRQALSLDNSSALSYFLMGCTLSRLGESESAGAHLQQAQTIDPRYAFRR